MNIKLLTLALSIGAAATAALPLQHLGTDYGGWAIPIELLNPDSICYCVGAGEDVSFDIALINRVNCTVFCFDPTPKAITHIQHVYAGFSSGKKVGINHSKSCYHLDNPAAIEKLKFFNYGVWNSNEIINFYFPKNPSHVSCSALNLQHTNDFIPVTCKTISTIMQELGHTHIDLLKLDIEGAEYPVLDNMLAESILPTILCIEFHSTKKFNREQYITALKNAGYTLARKKGDDYTFIHGNNKEN